MNQPLFDPWEFLNLAYEADEKAIKNACHLVRKEQNPELFEKACHLLQDSEEREKLRMLLPRPLENPQELMDLFAPRPRYLGPGPWISFIKQQKERKKESSYDNKTRVDF